MRNAMNLNNIKFVNEHQSKCLSLHERLISLKTIQQIIFISGHLKITLLQNSRNALVHSFLQSKVN